jgi:hypothetical protein
MWQESNKEFDCKKHGIKYIKKEFVPGKNAALESIAWQKKLVYTEDEIFDDEKKYLIGTPTEQALTMIEIETLYLWWVENRPNRIDPFEKFPDPFFDQKLEKSKTDGVMSFFCLGTPQEELEKKQRYEKIDTLQKQYECEDDEMLTRLIKIRKTLWT